MTLHFPMKPRLYRGFNDAVAIERGPLIFALPIEAEWKKVKDNPQFADWEVYPKSPWNYALQLDREHPERSIAFAERAVGKEPFSTPGAPVIARVKGRRVPAWGLERGAAAPPPRSPVATTEPLEDLTLIPYGCTDLRITEFPVSPIVDESWSSLPTDHYHCLLRRMTKSIVGKLTLFVGVLVGLNTALLIGAAYVTTSAILRDQVRDRLEAIAERPAGDPAACAPAAAGARRRGWPGRAPIRALFARYAGGTMPAEPVRGGGRRVPRQRPDARGGPAGPLGRGRCRPDPRRRAAPSAWSRSSPRAERMATEPGDRGRPGGPAPADRGDVCGGLLRRGAR